MSCFNPPDYYMMKGTLSKDVYNIIHETVCKDERYEHPNFLAEYIVNELRIRGRFYFSGVTPLNWFM